MTTDQLRAAAEAIRGGDKSRAREILKPILISNPSADAWYLAALAVNNREQAIIFLKKALDLDPFHQRATKALTRLEIMHPTSSETFENEKNTSRTTQINGGKGSNANKRSTKPLNYRERLLIGLGSVDI